MYTHFGIHLSILHQLKLLTFTFHSSFEYLCSATYSLPNWPFIEVMENIPRLCQTEYYKIYKHVIFWVMNNTYNPHQFNYISKYSLAERNFMVISNEIENVFYFNSLRSTFKVSINKSIVTHDMQSEL